MENISGNFFQIFFAFWNLHLIIRANLQKKNNFLSPLSETAVLWRNGAKTKRGRRSARVTGAERPRRSFPCLASINGGERARPLPSRTTNIKSAGKVVDSCKHGTVGRVGLRQMKNRPPEEGGGGDSARGDGGSGRERGDDRERQTHHQRQAPRRCHS